MTGHCSRAIQSYKHCTGLLSFLGSFLVVFQLSDQQSGTGEERCSRTLTTDD